MRKYSGGGKWSSHTAICHPEWMLRQPRLDRHAPRRPPAAVVAPPTRTEGAISSMIAFAGGGRPPNPHQRTSRLQRAKPPTTPRDGRVERLSAITRPATSGTHAPGGTPRGNRRAVLVTSGTHAPGTPNHPLCPAQKRTPERGEGHRANYCPPSWRRSQRSLILSMKDEPARRVEGGESAP